MIIIEWALGIVGLMVIYSLVGTSAMVYAPLSGLFGSFPYRVRTNQRLLALTFDDGPNPPDTNALLDVLKRHGVHATFFVVGKNLERHPDVVRTMVAHGHSIGNHTYSHKFSSYFSRSAFIREVERNQQAIKTILGSEPTLFRPPWLFRLPWTLKVLKARGLTAVSAAFGYEFEVIHQDPRSIARRAVTKARPGMIMDFHDGYDAQGGNRRGTVEAIDQLIPELKSQGYQFVTVEQLLAT